MVLNHFLMVLFSARYCTRTTVTSRADFSSSISVAVNKIQETVKLAEQGSLTLTFLRFLLYKSECATRKVLKTLPPLNQMALPLTKDCCQFPPPTVTVHSLLFHESISASGVQDPTHHQDIRIQILKVWLCCEYCVYLVHIS